MGKVSALLEVKPDGPDIDLDNLLDTCETELPEGVTISDSSREPVGFGIEKLLIQVIFPDDTGGADEVADIFEGIDGVQSVDVSSVSRL